MDGLFPAELLELAKKHLASAQGFKSPSSRQAFVPSPVSSDGARGVWRGDSLTDHAPAALDDADCIAAAWQGACVQQSRTFATNADAPRLLVSKTTLGGKPATVLPSAYLDGCLPLGRVVAKRPAHWAPESHVRAQRPRAVETPELPFPSFARSQMEALQGHRKSSASAGCPAPVSGWAHSTLPLAMHGSSGYWAKLQPAYADAAGDVTAEGYGSDGSHCAADGSSPASRAERCRNISAAGARADSDTPAAAAADADGASSGGEDHSGAPAKGAAKPASSSSAVALAAETDGPSPDSKRDVSSSTSAAAGALLPETLLELLSRAGGAPGADGAEPTAAFGLAAAKALVRTVAAALGVGDGGDGDIVALTKILGRLPAAGASVPAPAPLELAPLALGTPAEARAATGSAAAAAAAANVAHPSGSGDADDEGEEASSGWASASRRADRGKEAATAAATAAAASPSLPPPLPASLLTPLPAAAPPSAAAAAAAPTDGHAEEAAAAGGCMDEGLGDPDGVDPDRVHCPFPGCTRSFKELWRLKVHYRARPDVRGSGKERGHGMELERCPRCETRLLRGRHHKCALSRAALTAAVTRSSPPPPPAPAPAPPPPTRAAQKAQQARLQQPQPVKVKAEQVPHEAEPYEEPYEEEAPYDPLDMLASAAAMLTGR